MSDVNNSMASRAKGNRRIALVLVLIAFAAYVGIALRLKFGAL